MMVNWRRKKNMLRGLRVGEAWVEEPVRVKEVVKNYFQENISQANWERPKLDEVTFREISFEDTHL